MNGVSPRNAIEGVLDALAAAGADLIDACRCLDADRIEAAIERRGAVVNRLAESLAAMPRNERSAYAPSIRVLDEEVRVALEIVRDVTRGQLDEARKQVRVRGYATTPEALSALDRST